MSTNTIDSTAATATSQRRPAKSESGRKSAKSAKAKPANKSKTAAKPKARRANKKAEVMRDLQVCCVLLPLAFAFPKLTY